MIVLIRLRHSCCTQCVGLHWLVFSEHHRWWYVFIRLMFTFTHFTSLAQLLNAVNNDLPGFGGVLIIAIATFIVTLFGYKIVHAYEFWSWIPCFIVFLIVLGEFAHSGVSYTALSCAL